MAEKQKHDLISLIVHRGLYHIDDERIETNRLRKDKLIMATKEIDEQILPDKQIIEVYRDMT